jgi:hypothetical protein
VADDDQLRVVGARRLPPRFQPAGRFLRELSRRDAVIPAPVVRELEEVLPERDVERVLDVLDELRVAVDLPEAGIRWTSRITDVALIPSMSSTSTGSSSSFMSFRLPPSERKAFHTAPPEMFQTSLPSLRRTLPVMPGMQTTTSRIRYLGGMVLLPARVVRS